MQAAELRREIRAVVNTVQRLGWIATILASLSALWFAGYLLELLIGVEYPDRWPCGPLWAVACTAVALGAHLYREWRRRGIRRRLAALTALERQEIVWPLRAGRGDVGHFTRAVIRGLSMPAELAPAAPVDGRGDEPGAA